MLSAHVLHADTRAVALTLSLSLSAFAAFHRRKGKTKNHFFFDGFIMIKASRQAGEIKVLVKE